MGGRGVTLLLGTGVLIAAVTLGVHGALLPAAVPAEAPAQCADARELLAPSSAFEGGAGVPVGHLVACVDEDHRRLTLHNRTPVVWSLGDASVRGVASGTDGVTGLLSLHASQSSSGLLLAPGSAASVSAGEGRVLPRPDETSTRIQLALTAVVAAQDQAIGTSAGPDNVIRSAALTCAVAIAEAGTGWEVTPPSALAAAAADPGCRRDWDRAQRSATASRMALPGLIDALSAPEGQKEEAALERAAADWFSASTGFSWGGVERPEPLP
ncbi:hypothetical protein [Rathayibacter iranicus]|uniref:Uncharacterized protein n=2 Tax=Rathayibacter iranicus TaxID=59737 RepID=A0AAD1ACW3_9MICO|nr:hypothetical protein [Rathayibacter iranicus]AZZ54725.1 hypothetical protein C7V51_01605 [Rathayibacter iranicus]MWV30515.1 hypothetical protein [Rathayibacter iranicus NCPPB 2253 = VKM Ac-1602]PPI50982.1 hypothetical protein C5E09_01650 [Rathayibacter iranicus]PPI62922.1 hypothetical protein C5E08_01650 [Rathayibacter iranicus]PPI74214.1 hypothetical protein C5E01_01630 [Rathayibacter iranicus]